jgi:ABC-type branched-subunit amino acid transport system ATPase component
MTIEVAGLQVRFGGVVALADVDVTLERGEVLAVIGPNGSGKSTLFNAITGFVQPSRGAIRCDDLDLAGVPAYQRVVLGISRTFQTPRIDPDMPVEIAIRCGFYPHARIGFFGGLLRLPQVSASERRIRDRAAALLDSFGLSGLASSPIGSLPMGLIRMVDLARAMAANPKYLLVDEPAAGLALAEQALLSERLLQLAQQDVGILLVEHNFALVSDLARRVVVLDRGSVLVHGTAQEVSRNPDFMRAYLGSGVD